MLYTSGAEFKASPKKRVLLFAMSGLGKTHLSNMLRESGDWFHYSIDYRIGTRHMSEFIADNAKAKAMQVPFLREMLLSDSIYIASNITFDNLSAVAAYLGKPGSAAKGGLPMDEYRRRQSQFHFAETTALLETQAFIDRAERLYGYPHFICDTGGSICEWVDPDDPNDHVLKALSETCLMVWIKGSEDHTAELVRRFDKAPKPMAYQPAFLARSWEDYLSENKCQEDDVDPDSFIRWTYAKALAHRQPLYQAMADKWGITVEADAMASAADETTFIDVIAAAIDAQAATA